MKKNSIKTGSEQFLDLAIQTLDNECVGCNHCARICPIESANVIVQDEVQSVKVNIDHSQCIKCGKCLEVCKHSARFVHDDLTRFLGDLEAGKDISVVLAPSIRTNIPEWRQLIGWLRQLGVKFVYDVALGADICIWAHLRLIEKNPGPIITQPCPSIVAYCERHKHELLPFLSPIHSPMACTAIYMHKQGVEHGIASLSPCVAKSLEHGSTKLIQYNITFVKLLEYIKRNHIELPKKESGFDHYNSGPGLL